MLVPHKVGHPAVLLRAIEDRIPEITKHFSMAIRDGEVQGGGGDPHEGEAGGQEADNESPPESGDH